MGKTDADYNKQAIITAEETLCLYTCIESAEITAPFIFFASFIDKAVFPTAVGPARMTSGFMKQSS